MRRSSARPRSARTRSQRIVRDSDHVTSKRDKARPTLVEGLKAAGATVDVVSAYRNLPVDEMDEETRDLVRAG